MQIDLGKELSRPTVYYVMCAGILLGACTCTTYPPTRNAYNQVFRSWLQGQFMHPLLPAFGQLL